jgi:hypothetical protein
MLDSRSTFLMAFKMTNSQSHWLSKNRQNGIPGGETTELYNNWRTCSYTSFSNRSEAKKMADFDVCSRHFHDNWSVILTQLPLTNRDPELQTTFSPPWFWHCF